MPGLSENSTTQYSSGHLERKVAELEALNHLAQAIGSTLEVDKILEIILNESMKFCSAEQGTILSLSAKDDRPVHTLVKAAKSDAGDQLSKLSDLISGWAQKSGKSLMTENITTDERFRKAEKWLEGFSAVLAVPMVVRGAQTGIIVLTKSESFTEDDLQLMTIVANQCGQFLENAKQYQAVYQENVELRQEVEKEYDLFGLIGESPEMSKVFELLKRIIPGETRTLIEGETGTGKELVARIIHYNGPRKARKFIPVDCGALPETLLESELFGHVKGAFTGATADKKGLFEVADQGTLFLDEISNTTLAFQAKLLRAIQEGEIRPVGATQPRKVDVRIVAATSSDLKSKVGAEEFRKDLYFRLNVVAVHLPPLRQRLSDIRLLTQHFLQSLLSKVQPAKRLLGFTAEAMRHLEHYDWPGNIRELENAIERAIALALPEDELISPELLPSHIVAEPHAEAFSVDEQINLAEWFADSERRIISMALQRHKGNRTQAAKSLGIIRQTLLAKMKKYDLV